MFKRIRNWFCRNTAEANLPEAEFTESTESDKELSEDEEKANLYLKLKSDIVEALEKEETLSQREQQKWADYTKWVSEWMEAIQELLEVATIDIKADRDFVHAALTIEEERKGLAQIALRSEETDNHFIVHYHFHEKILNWGEDAGYFHFKFYVGSRAVRHEVCKSDDIYPTLLKFFAKGHLKLN